MCFFHDYPMDFFFEKNPPGLAAGNRHGRGHSVPGRPGWVVIFPWEKMSFSLEHVGKLWEMMGKYGKIMGKDGKIWNNDGKIKVSTWWVVVRSSFCGL